MPPNVETRYPLVPDMFHGHHGLVVRFLLHLHDPLGMNPKSPSTYFPHGGLGLQMGVVCLWCSDPLGVGCCDFG
jgi:hypothetical protein